MRSVIVVLLVTLSLRTAGVLSPPPLDVAAKCRCIGLKKVLPISLRERAEIDRRIHLPPREANNPLPAAAPPFSCASRLVCGNTFLPYGTVLVHLLLRLQL
jgi:hypothetical protein